MTTLLEIKPCIHDFIQENLDEKFGNKVYWIGERVNEPDYPYCMLSVISENKDKRTSTHNGEIETVDPTAYFRLNENNLNVQKYFYFDQSLTNLKRIIITTLYKRATITVAIYNAWVSDTYTEMDMDEAKSFTYSQINRLEELFETRINQQEFYPFFSIQSISPIRALHEVVDGGYQYRFEFDLTIGYDEQFVERFELGKKIEGEIKINNDENRKILFSVDSRTY